MEHHTAPTLLWFRLDLRLRDNPALIAAAERKTPLLPIFIWAPQDERPWEPGAASRVWLHYALKSLQESLVRRGGRLYFFKGDTQEILDGIIRQTGANDLYWNRRYEPKVIERDTRLKQRYQKRGLELKSFNSHLLFEPWDLQTQEGNPYRVYTPFWKTLKSLQVPEPRPEPKHISWYQSDSLPGAIALNDLELLPRIPWDQGIRSQWTPGEKTAQKQWKKFLNKSMPQYEKERDRPDLGGTSRLSPHLHFGEISPRQIWHDIRQVESKENQKNWKSSAEKYLSELCWREFAHHLLYHYPHTTQSPLQEKFNNFPWRKNSSELRAWQQGKTGYPLVDAGMRELWHTGYMHNRVRMVVASFLIKDLRLRWSEGAKWFWDTLVDADLANNTLGWQWCAGCGADAAPFFRIFNPTTQAEKFDPEGRYIRKWIPELKKLKPPQIFFPKKVSEKVPNYPEPLVDHPKARREALALFMELSTKPGGHGK